MKTIKTTSMIIIDENVEANKDRKAVRDIAGREYQIIAINEDEKKIVLNMGIFGDTLKAESRNWRGMVFFCQGCCKWRGMSKLICDKYPDLVICFECVELYTDHESKIERWDIDDLDIPFEDF